MNIYGINEYLWNYGYETEENPKSSQLKKNFFFNDCHLFINYIPLNS